VLKKELSKHLRTGRKMRQSKKYNTKGITRGQIINGVSMRNRPPEIEDRSIPGHWEGDLIAGSGNTHIATLVERHSQFTILVKINGKDAATVTSALSQQVKYLPSILRKSLTWDRGMGLAFHKKFTLETNIQVYFCDPKNPWQRGTNESTNGLLRQYLHKKTDLSVYSQQDLKILHYCRIRGQENNSIILHLAKNCRRVLHWQVEFAAAFFRISRSIFRHLFSLRRRLSSALMPTLLSLSEPPLSPSSYSHFQRPSKFA
jgi:Integrase core domain